MTEVRPEEHVSILVNPMPSVPVIEARNPVSVSIGGTESPTGTESPGTSQMSPPPSYYDIPGKCLTFFEGQPSVSWKNTNILSEALRCLDHVAFLVNFR
jgi:hypothetical protein